MHKRSLGQTTIEVSALGLGTVKLGRNEGMHYPESFALPSDREMDILLSKAKEFGINLLDTAPAYGQSEERLGKWLTGQRHEWVISTKVGETFQNGKSHFDFSPTAIKKSIAQSLQKLKTDYLDIVLVHSQGEDEHIIHEYDVFATLAACKEAGMIRAYGMSTKTVVGGLLTLQNADLAMVTFHPGYDEERAVIQEAQRLQKGIFIKKAFASGHLHRISHHDPISDSMRYIFNEPGVTSIILGTINLQHLEENVQKYKKVVL